MYIYTHISHDIPMKCSINKPLNHQQRGPQKNPWPSTAAWWGKAKAAPTVPTVPTVAASPKVPRFFPRFFYGKSRRFEWELCLKMGLAQKGNWWWRIGSSGFGGYLIFRQTPWSIASWLYIYMGIFRSLYIRYLEGMTIYIAYIYS